MNWLDVVLALIIGGSLISGFLKGFARIGIGLAATVAAVVCGSWFYGVAGGYFEPYLSSRALANLAGFLAIFFGVFLLGALVSKLVSMLFRWVGLSFVDRLLGAGFGLLRGAVIAIVLVMALMAFSPKPPPRSIVRSTVAPYLMNAAQLLAGITPRELRDGFETSWREVRKVWQEALNRPKPESY